MVFKYGGPYWLPRMGMLFENLPDNEDLRPFWLYARKFRDLAEVLTVAEQVGGLVLPYMPVGQSGPTAP